MGTGWKSLSDSELLYGYKEVVLYVESSVKKDEDKKGFRIQVFNQSLSSKTISIKNTKSKQIIRGFDERICFLDYTPYNDSYSGVFSILRRIRNAFAHGHISASLINGRKWLSIEDNYNGLKMRGHMPFTQFKQLIYDLKNSKGKK